MGVGSLAVLGLSRVGSVLPPEAQFPCLIMHAGHYKDNKNACVKCQAHGRG